MSNTTSNPTSSAFDGPARTAATATGKGPQNAAARAPLDGVTAPAAAARTDADSDARADNAHGAHSAHSADEGASAAVPPLVSKLPKVGTTIFTVMSQLAQEHGALNLSQGFPDFDGPELLLERVSHYLRDGRNQYAPMTGVPALREAIARKVQDLYAHRADPVTEITVTSGATEALFCAIHAVVTPGDEVIVFDPAYDSYEPAVELAGGRCVHLPLRAPDHSVDWDAVRAAITPRTRMIIVNTPHNPTGSVFAPADLDALAEIVRGTGIWLLADEVYEHIVFDGAQHQSLLLRPELAARAFVVSSFGKTYHVTGWKIGYCVAPAALSAEFRKVHQYVTFTSITPVQLALADFLAAHPEHHLNLPAFYQRKRDRFCTLLEGSRFTLRPAGGTYFQLLDYSAISDEPDVALARRLTVEHGIASIPVSVFCAEPTGEPVLRFCYAKDDDTLARAAELLCAI